MKQSRDTRNKSQYVQSTNTCQGAKNTQWLKSSFFNKWEDWITTSRKMKLDSYLIPLTKMNSKWIRDVNMSWIHKTPRRKHGKCWSWQQILGYDTTSTNNRIKKSTSGTTSNYKASVQKEKINTMKAQPT